MCRMLSGRKRWIVQEVCRAASPSWEPCCVIPSGTGEGRSARVNAANSQRDRAKEGRRSARRQSTSSLGKKDEYCVTSVASLALSFQVLE